jgi:hypothetical protein
VTLAELIASFIQGDNKVEFNKVEFGHLIVPWANQIVLYITAEGVKDIEFHRIGDAQYEVFSLEPNNNFNLYIPISEGAYNFHLPESIIRLKEYLGIYNETTKVIINYQENC